MPTSSENSEHDEQQTTASHSSAAKLNAIEDEAASDLSGLMNHSASNALGQKNDSGISSAGASIMMTPGATCSGSKELGSANNSSGNRKPWFTKQFVQKFIEFEIDSVQVPGGA